MQSATATSRTFRNAAVMEQVRAAGGAAGGVDGRAIADLRISVNAILDEVQQQRKLLRDIAATVTDIKSRTCNPAHEDFWKVCDSFIC